ncbi:MAG: ABC transporter ATP-binding protein [Candidatus Deferrimicrobiaceae bacterium]
MSGHSPICEPCGLETLPEADGEPLIRLVNVEKTLDGKKVLDGVNLDIPRRRITAIIGLSGAGKSVMLKHMIGLIRPERGQVLVDGVDISRLSRGELYRVRRRFGMLFQGGALFDSLTVYENVAFPLREKTELGEGEIRERVLSRLAQVGLEGSRGKFPDELSGGMVRRVAFARAMVTDPEIILFDEPTTGLDPIIRNSILNLICHAYHQQGFTMVMISHDIPEIFLWSHYVVVLHDGKVVEAAPTAEVVHSVNPFVQQLIRGDITGPVHLM